MRPGLPAELTTILTHSNLEATIKPLPRGRVPRARQELK